MAELSGKSAKIRFTSVAATSSTGEAATLTSATGGDFVQVTATDKRHWLRDSTGFVLYLNSTAVSSTAYTINPVQGKFEFKSTGQSTGTYTADVRYLTNTYLTGARSWSMDVDTDMLDVTTFSTSTADVQWRSFITGLSEAEMTLSRLISTGDTGPVFFDRLNLPGDVIVEAVTNDFNRFEGYGYVSEDSFESSVDDLAVESVTVKITGELYYSSS